MIKHLTILLFLLFVIIHPSHAHRLNEYLQATRITLLNNSINLKIDLTTGSELAEKLLKEIDSNDDGILSFTEMQSYTGRVAAELSLVIDGTPASIQILSWHFPEINEIKNGTGEIQLFLSAPYPWSRQTHHLVFKSQQNPLAVYLVNCLQPSDRAIMITAQSRSIDQSVYSVNFTIGNLPNLISGKSNGNFAIVKTFVQHGVGHILTGYDHILFLCALLLGAASLWDLVKIVTAFTIAHSVTLTLAALGLVHVPSYITEPLIAASIVCIALQNIFRPTSGTGVLRIAVVFLFGLFHGLGFAGGLLELMHAMPRQSLIYALLGFSIGVEAGNQLVLLPLYGILRGLNGASVKSLKTTQTITLQLCASALVAVAGLYYLIISLNV